MIKEKSNIKTILAVVVALAIVIYSAIGIDYSGLSTFSTAMAKDVFVGLLKPDWSFVYDGSG